MKRIISNKNILVLFAILFSTFSLSAQMVYKTPSGAKYHRAECRMVKNVSEKLSVAEAAKQGLAACKICNPVNLPVAGSAKATQGQAPTTQCKGKTKAGNRCLHKTGIGNGYCFQHQPGK